MVGVGAYSVTVEMADSGGIFTNAEVTYLGVPAGRVGALRLTKSGVSVELVLDSVGPQIPDSATAVVANRSAIGEQFVDLQPSTTSGPYLHDGSVIERFELPRPLEDVVSSALDFADSIPVEDLRTVVTELGNAFSGQGENLTRLVTSLSNLSRAGVDNISETVALLSNAESVLATQAAARSCRGPTVSISSPRNSRRRIPMCADYFRPGRPRRRSCPRSSTVTAAT